MSISVLADRNKDFARRLLNGITASLPVLLLILMSLLLTSSKQLTSVKAEEEEGGLEGTWLNEVKIVSCAPAPPQVFATFPSMITYMRGGTLTEDGSPASPAVSRSGSHGIWKHAGSRNFHVFFRFHSFDSQGRLVSIVEVTTDQSLMNGELNGNGTNKITNLNPDDGTVINVSEGCNKSSSRRLSFED